MILFLYGPDSYRRQKNLSSVIKAYREKYSVFSINHFSFEDESDFLRLRDFCGQTNLFDSKKMAIAKNFLTAPTQGRSSDKIVGANKELSKDIKAFLKENIKSENTIIIVAEDSEPGKDFEFLLKEAAKIYEFQNLSGAHLEFFIKKEAEERKIDLSADAVGLLAKIFQNNTWGAVTELEKLESLKSKNQIVAKDLEKQITYFEKPDVFRFIDSVSIRQPADKTIGQKLFALENIILNKEEPAKVFNILASRPFLSFEQVKNLADYDVLIKSGKLDYELALLDLILN